MQFTGLQDKDKKDIYEGDIVRWHHGADAKDGGVDVVEFVSGCFCLGEPGRYSLSVFCHPFSNELHIDIEVIGNIHENPEFLK
jgi:uncharacterized phage protein (TIGR01671 family)